MSRILCVTSELAGVQRAGLRLAQRLQAAGFSVVYASPAEGPDSAMRAAAAGVRFSALAPISLAPAPQLARERGSRFVHKVREWRTRRARMALGVEALGMDAFRTLLADEAPDLVLLDSELHEHILTAKSMGLRFALLEHFFATSRRRGLPPLGASILPGAGFTGSRLGLSCAWLRARTGRWLQIQRTNLSYLGADRHGVLRRYARECGASDLRTRRLDWQGLFTYPDLPTLAMTAAELEFPHRPPAHVHYVGPMIDPSREEGEAGEEAAQEAVAEVVAAARRAGQKILFATATTMGGGRDGFTDRLLQAVATHPEWLLILTAGDAELERPLPDNVAVFEWVPQLAVLAAADLAIPHGGIHTLHECVAFEVPMLVYSGGRFDQNGCAARIAFHGLGVRGRRREDSPSEIAARIAGLLGDASVPRRLASMARACRRYEEQGVLENLVGAWVGG